MTALLSRRQLIDQFILTPEEMTYLDRISAVQIAGAQHGRAGLYPDGDFSSDADWCYGIGREIRDLEEALDIDDGSIGDLYSNAHSAFFRDGTINPGERDWCPNIYDMWFGACAPTTVSVHAKSFEDALETAAEWLQAQGEVGLFVSQEEQAELLAEACAERGIKPEDIDWSDLRGVHAEAVEAAEADLTPLDGGLWIRSDEWGGDGPRLILTAPDVESPKADRTPAVLLE